MPSMAAPPGIRNIYRQQLAPIPLYSLMPVVCQGTVNFTINAGPSLTGSAVGTATSCPTVNDGTITRHATNGTAPYQYSLNAGPSQASNIFTNLAPVPIISASQMPLDAGYNNSNRNSRRQPRLRNIVTANPPCANINDGVITVNLQAGKHPIPIP